VTPVVVAVVETGWPVLQIGSGQLAPEVDVVVAPAGEMTTDDVALSIQASRSPSVTSSAMSALRYGIEEMVMAGGRTRAAPTGRRLAQGDLPRLRSHDQLLDRSWEESTLANRGETSVTASSESSAAHQSHVDPHDAVRHLGDTPRFVESCNRSFHRLGIVRRKGGGTHSRIKGRQSRK
jgi:hypothetical protein